jgi:hypothetical protein
MSEIIERAARALADDTLKRWRSPLGVRDDAWREFVPAARAVLLAIREPSEGMTTAATELWWLDFDGDEEIKIRVSAEQARQIWHAMLDAAE